MSRTTKTVLFVIACYLAVGSMERADYDSLDNNPFVIEYQTPGDYDDYDGPDADQLTEPLIRS